MYALREIILFKRRVKKRIRVRLELFILKIRYVSFRYIRINYGILKSVSLHCKITRRIYISALKRVCYSHYQVNHCFSVKKISRSLILLMNGSFHNSKLKDSRRKICERFQARNPSKEKSYDLYRKSR